MFDHKKKHNIYNKLLNEDTYTQREPKYNDKEYVLFFNDNEVSNSKEMNELYNKMDVIAKKLNDRTVQQMLMDIEESFDNISIEEETDKQDTIEVLNNVKKIANDYVGQTNKSDPISKQLLIDAIMNHIKAIAIVKIHILKKKHKKTQEPDVLNILENEQDKVQVINNVVNKVKNAKTANKDKNMDKLYQLIHEAQKDNVVVQEIIKQELVKQEQVNPTKVNKTDVVIDAVVKSVDNVIAQSKVPASETVKTAIVSEALKTLSGTSVITPNVINEALKQAVISENVKQLFSETVKLGNNEKFTNMLENVIESEIVDENENDMPIENFVESEMEMAKYATIHPNQVNKSVCNDDKKPSSDYYNIPKQCEINNSCGVNNSEVVGYDTDYTYGTI
jgi:hypothetical protein